MNAYIAIAQTSGLPESVKYILIGLGFVGVIALAWRAAVVRRYDAEHKSDTVAEEQSTLPPPITVPAVRFEADDGALIAAITAAVSLVLEAEGKDPKGFRVVSFKRTKK